MIKLVNDTIDNKDIDSLIDWLGKYPRLTKGPITLECCAISSMVNRFITCNTVGYDPHTM